MTPEEKRLRSRVAVLEEQQKAVMEIIEHMNPEKISQVKELRNKALRIQEVRP